MVGTDGGAAGAKKVETGEADVLMRLSGVMIGHVVVPISRPKHSRRGCFMVGAVMFTTAAFAETAALIGDLTRVPEPAMTTSPGRSRSQ